MPAEPCARLHHPSRPLAAIVHLGVERDTRCLILDDAQRLNFYPASPLAVMSWIFCGPLHMVQSPAGQETLVLSEAFTHLMFAGPSRTPSVSWSPGPVHAISIGIYPDVLSNLFGIQAADYLNVVLPADQVLPEAACQVLAQVKGDQKDPFGQIEAAILQLVRDAPIGGRAASLSHWLMNLMAQLCTTHTGRGLRQMQRSIRRTVGQSHRDLQLYVRAERAFTLMQQQDPVWSEVELEAGYTDQSHLGREVKRVSGFSPARFAQRMKSDEAFWMYRLLGES